MIQTHRTWHRADTHIATHRHQQAYVALVLSGGYLESGPDGAWQCSAGELVVHPPYHLHANSIGSSDARVLNFLLPIHVHENLDHGSYGVFAVPDPGRLERVSRHDPFAALAEAAEVKEQRHPQPSSLWLDGLAATLAQAPERPVAALARDSRCTPEHLSRAFRKRFGIAPAVFRREHRLRRALRLLVESRRDLCDIAADCGFADQPHMTRELKQMTGLTPLRLQRALRQARTP
jgi:AraC-like DNA-binding protein